MCTWEKIHEKFYGKTIGSVLGIIGLVVSTNLAVNAVKSNSGNNKAAQSSTSNSVYNRVMNKVDVTFVEPFFGAGFMKSNPGPLKNIALQRPIRVFGNTMMFKRGETEFKQMMNSAFEELLNQGYVDDLISKYEPFPGAFYRAQQPYRVDGVPNSPEVKIPVKLPEAKAKAK